MLEGEDCILEATEGAEYRESVICSTPVEVRWDGDGTTPGCELSDWQVIFLHAEDCVKLVAPNKVTVDLLRQAIRTLMRIVWMDAVTHFNITYVKKICCES